MNLNLPVEWLGRFFFIDKTPPLFPGQPEPRDYRVQGFVNNARTGNLSTTASIVIMP